MSLLRLVELVLVIRKDCAAGLLCWDAFLAMAERTGSLGFAFPALKLCDELAPGTVPASSSWPRAACRSRYQPASGRRT